jgi:putative transcriptional regulator
LLFIVFKDELIYKIGLIRHNSRVMDTTKNSNVESFLHDLGARLAELRLAKNLTQAELAERAGVAKRTIERLESGAAATQLSGFIRVCRALDILERFNQLIPESLPSPIAQLKLRGKQRRRASSVAARERPSKKWVWGDNS